jgi:hypothetical protein
MISLARFSIRQPAVVLSAWPMLPADLAVIGLGVSLTLSQPVTVVVAPIPTPPSTPIRASR